MADLLEFSWDVVAKGYEWANKGKPYSHTWTKKEYEEFTVDNRYLVGRETYGGFGETYQVKRYFPLNKDHADLFQVFAAVVPDTIGIQRFANEYGLLGGKYSVGVEFITVVRRMVELYRNRPDFPATRISFEPNYTSGEPFAAWVNQILKMKHAVKVWSLLNRRDETGLREYVKWHHKIFYFVDPETDEKLGNSQLIDSYANSGDENKIVQGEIRRPARVLLAGLINENLKGQVSPMTLCRVGLEETTLRFIPESLLGALWLQFAQALDKSYAYRQCEECGIWFDIAKHVGARSDKRTCGATCKKRRQRRLKQEQSASLTH